MPDAEGKIFPIQRETVVDQLVRNIEKEIFSGKRPQKSKISEIGIAAEFGVSRVPAREALQRLEKMNLVRKTRSGREVAQFSRDEFKHIYELKNVVEAFGAMKGALHARSEDIRHIEKIIARMAEAIDRGDTDHLLRLNHAFHDAMVFCCANPKVIETFSSLAQQVRWAVPISLRVGGRPVMGYREHVEIFDAFRKKEAEKVRLLLEKHSNCNMTRILEEMERKKQ
ncbi:MAG: GntR family transcriptional regulator [Thermodesulfobacteriota bacterium]